VREQRRSVRKHASCSFAHSPFLSFVVVVVVVNLSWWWCSAWRSVGARTGSGIRQLRIWGSRPHWKHSSQLYKCTAGGPEVGHAENEEINVIWPFSFNSRIAPPLLTPTEEGIVMVHELLPKLQ